MNENVTRPIVISVVSGKGGVGKSRISLILARILSKNYKVLLIDFDQHNQGLTHLIDTECKKCDPASGNFIAGEYGYVPAEIAPGIYFVPALRTVFAGPQNELELLLARYTPADFRGHLEKLVDSIRSRVPVRFVVIDNTGIPDDFSLGSALYADRVLLITQTDSVTWRGALNFYSLYEHNGGDPARINFIVNNIPKKYSYELVNLEVNRLGEVFKNMGFTLFIPFEYGIFESFDKNPFEDHAIEKSEFYEKIRLLSAIIIKETNVEKSFELEAIYSRKNFLNRSLGTKLDRSDDSRKQLLIVKAFLLTFASLFVVFGLVTVDTFYPQAIPTLLNELNDGRYFPLAVMAVSFLLAAGMLSMSAERFVKIISALDEKTRGEQR